MRRKNVALASAMLLAATGVVYLKGVNRNLQIRHWYAQQKEIYGTPENPNFTLKNAPPQTPIFTAIEQLFNEGQISEDQTLEQKIKESVPDFSDSELADIPYDLTKQGGLIMQKSILSVPVKASHLEEVRSDFEIITGRLVPTYPNKAGIDFYAEPKGTPYFAFRNLKRSIPQATYPRDISGLQAMLLDLGAVPPQRTPYLINEGVIDPFVYGKIETVQKIIRIADKVGLEKEAMRLYPDPQLTQVQLQEAITAMALDTAASYPYVEAMLRRMYARDPITAVRAKIAFEARLFHLAKIPPHQGMRDYLAMASELHRETRQRFSTLEEQSDYLLKAPIKEYRPMIADK